MQSTFPDLAAHGSAKPDVIDMYWFGQQGSPCAASSAFSSARCFSGLAGFLIRFAGGPALVGCLAESAGGAAGRVGLAAALGLMMPIVSSQLPTGMPTMPSACIVQDDNF